MWSLPLLLLIASCMYCSADVECPNDPILCRRCIASCPRNQSLVESPCGCCYNQCVPKTKCPDPPIQCLVCHFSCPENQTLKVSPCGCCHNQCVPSKNRTLTGPKPVCLPDYCQRIRCYTPTCPVGQILVQGQGICGCCPGCVTPKREDKCYEAVNTGELTCGSELKCHHEICLYGVTNSLSI